MVQLDYRDARPIYTQIVDGFREQIVAGILLQGDRMPSVRELACQLTINPNTIQRAYRELEMEGWIASVPGKGSFVCGVPSGPQREAAVRAAEFSHNRRGSGFSWPEPGGIDPKNPTRREDSCLKCGR